MRVIDREKLDKLESYISAYAMKNNGDMPVLSEIMRYTEMSKATAYRYILRLEVEGKIKYSGKGTLELKEKTSAQKKYLSVRVPIFGSVICGTPEEEQQNTEGYLAVPQEWINGECYLLRTRGDSMADVGIADGDLVLVRRSESAKEGQIVVALTDEGNTLKRLGYEGKKPVLYAQNHTYDESKRVIRPQRLEIQGIAVKLIKDI